MNKKMFDETDAVKRSKNLIFRPGPIFVQICSQLENCDGLSKVAPYFRVRPGFRRKSMPFEMRLQAAKKRFIAVCKQLLLILASLGGCLPV
jgi:hypothetical protein